MTAHALGPRGIAAGVDGVELQERGVPARVFVRDSDRAAAVLGDRVELAAGDFMLPRVRGLVQLGPSACCRGIRAGPAIRRR